MTAELTMPKLSDSVADAVILRWLKGPGDGFTRGEGLLEVETDKATVIYEAEHDGTLESILVQEGESAAVGQPIATLGGNGAVLEAANGSCTRRTRRIPTRRRSHGGPPWSSASRSTTSSAPVPAAGSLSRTCGGLRLRVPRRP